MKIKDWIKQFLFYYPFTLSGTILFSVSFYLLGKGFATGNPYGVLLSLLAFFTLIGLALGGRLQAVRFNRAQVQWDSSQPLYAGREGLEQKLSLEGIRTLYFYRLHFKLSGRLTVGRKAWLYISQETSSVGGGSHSIPLYFPLCGIFQAKGGFKVRDLFGLTRARFGRDQVRQLTVQPAYFSESESFPVDAAAGLEEETRKKSSDEEKFYMREYIPGDRFRDINWKVSSRLSELITRISPFTQEKTKTIVFEFRHFRKKNRETVESIIHLNYIKSWLLSLLRSVKKDEPDYHFLILTGSGTVCLETEDDIERFGRELSALFFQADPYEPEHDLGADELFIFTTPYDENLPLVLSTHPQTKFHIFRTASANGKIVKNRSTIHLFKHIPAPFLPGRWILFRDRNLANPKIGMQKMGRIEEENLEVRFFG